MQTRRQLEVDGSLDDTGVVALCGQQCHDDLHVLVSVLESLDLLARHTPVSNNKVRIFF